MARKLSDKEVKDVVAHIISSSSELTKLPTAELKDWLTRYKIDFSDEDIKALEDELVGFYGVNVNEAVMKVGEKYKITDGSGLDSGKIVTVVDPKNIKTRGDGVPSNVDGAYKPVDWKKEVAIQYEDGTYGTMFKSHLISADSEPKITIKEPKRKMNESEIATEFTHDSNGMQVYSLKIPSSMSGDNKAIKKALMIALEDENLEVESAKWLYQKPHIEVVLADGSKRLYVVYRNLDESRSPRQLVSESLRAMVINENKISNASQLVKGQAYTYTGGAEIVDLTYVGLANRNTDKKPGSSMGKGFLFQWPDGKYVEMGMNSIKEFLEESENVDEAVEPDKALVDKIHEIYDQLETNTDLEFDQEPAQRFYVYGFGFENNGTGYQVVIDDGQIDLMSEDGEIVIADIQDADEIINKLEIYGVDEASEESNSKNINNFIKKHFGDQKMVHTWLEDENEQKASIASLIYSKYDDQSNVLDEFRDNKKYDWFYLVKISDDIKAIFIAGMPDGMAYLKSDEEALSNLAKSIDEASVDGGKSESYLKKISREFRYDEISSSKYVKLVKEKINFYPFNLSKAIDSTLINKSERNQGTALLDTIMEYYGWNEDVFEAKDLSDGDDKEKLVLTQKKLFDSIYNMRAKDRLMLLDEVLEVEAGSIKDRAKKAAEILAKRPSEYKKALQMMMPHVHKAVYEEEDGTKFPMITEYGESDELVVHPMHPMLKKKKLSAIKINKEFEDDNLPCVNVTATLGGQKYKYSDWWLERKMLKKYHQAEAGDKGALQGIKNWLTRQGNEMLKEEKLKQKAAKEAAAVEEAANKKAQAQAEISELEKERSALIADAENEKKNKKRVKAIEKEIVKIVKANDIKPNEIEMLSSSVSEASSINEDEFIVHGTYTISNAGGYEIMLSDDGDSARVRDAHGSENPVTSDWLPIEHVPNEDDPEEMEAVIDPEGYNIPVSQIMKASNEAIDEDEFNVENRLKDVAFQYSQQMIAQDAAVTQILEILKDSETLSDTFKEIAPEALVDAVITHYGWTISDLSEGKHNPGLEEEIKGIIMQNLPVEEAGPAIRAAIAASDDDRVKEIADLTDEDEALIAAIVNHYVWDESTYEAVNDVVDSVDAKLKEICAQYYANLLPNAEALAKSREALETCEDEELAKLNESDDDDLMYNILRHFKWDAFELSESVGA